MYDFLRAICAALIGRILHDQWSASLPKIISWLVRGSASMLPTHQREVLESEWLAVAGDLDGPFDKLRHALGCFASALAVRQRERNILEKLNRRFATATAQVLSAGFLLWVIEVAATFSWARKFVDPLKLPVVTFLVHGRAKHAEAYLLAADAFVSIGNDDLAQSMRKSGNEIGLKVVDMMVDVSILHAMKEMVREGQFSPPAA